MENHNQTQNFFTKKRIIFISLFFLVVIAIISLTIVFIILPGINFKTLANSFAEAFKKDIEMSIILLFLLIIFLFVKAFANVYPYLLRLKQAKVKVKKWEAVIFAFFFSFITLISPANILTDPYSIFWLRTKGISLHKASAISLNTDFIYTIAALLLSWPSIIYMAFDGALGRLLNDPIGKTVFIFIFVGMGIDLIILSFLFVFGFSKRIHIFASLIFNKIRKMFKMSHLTKAQIVEKYMKEAVMRQEFVGMLKDFKGSLVIFATLFGLCFYMYLCIYISMFMLNDDRANYDLSFMHVFSAVNVANTANKFIPLPGGEGGIEMCLIELLKKSNGISMHDGSSVDWSKGGYAQNLVNGSTLFWRIFTAFLPALVGLVFGGFEIHNEIKKRKMHHLFNKPKDEVPIVKV